jgi:PAS domain S-box-containing protein
MPTDTWSSLKRRLPILLSALLCVALVGVCFGAYMQLRRQLTRSTYEHARAASQQIADVLDAGMQRLRAGGPALIKMPAIAAVIAHPTEATAKGLHDALFPDENSGNQQLRRLSILDRSGRVIATADSASGSLGTPSLALAPEVEALARASHELGSSPLFTRDGTVQFRLVDALVSGRDTVGFAVLEAQVTDTVGARRINKLIGPGAQVLLGNRSGDLWSDTRRPITGPATMFDTSRALRYTADDGETYDASQTHLASAPWTVLVRTPHDVAMQPARTFLYDIIGIAFLVLVGGVFLAWRLSRHVTTPLSDFSAAADDFASGDYARRIVVNRTDELGSMAEAFNSMAERVGRAVREREEHEKSLRTANAELRESESRYRQLVELSPDGIVVHQDGVIKFANAAAVRMLGAAVTSDLVDRPVADIVPPENHEATSARIARIQAGEEPMRLIEQTLRRLDGKSLHTETFAMRFLADGRPRVLSIIRDVTGRKRLEDQLRQSQKMEAVGQLAGGVAHDFNNLLTVIITYGELMLASHEDNEELAHDLKEVLGAAERAAGLTRQLLAFSRRQLLQPKIVDLSQLTLDLERMLGRLLPENIELVTRLAQPLGCVSADTGQIEQVVLNLVVNARDAMPSGGRIVIETSDVELDDDSPLLPLGSHGGPFVLLSVTDNGHGMDEETRLKIFDPFFTTKAPGKGTGLGLSTVYGIVKQSGGSISAYSEPGLGTTFKIYLPRVFEQPAVKAPSRNPLEVSGSETILLVEDDMRVRGAAERVLRSRGYTVITATDGANALTVAAQHSGEIDLMITDLVMPVMGGRALAEQISSVRPGMKVLFMSGYTEDAAARSSLMDPGAVFLSKPFTPDSLTAKVRETLRRASGVTTV